MKSSGKYDLQCHTWSNCLNFTSQDEGFVGKHAMEKSISYNIPFDNSKFPTWTWSASYKFEFTGIDLEIKYISHSI
jgi:hypothetical protein